MMKPKLAIVGLGYVGLPLAVALARQYDCIGLDINRDRVAALQNGLDATGEIDEAHLKATTLKLSSDPADMRGADVFIVTVPTPVDSANNPDLSALLAASRMLGAFLEEGRGQVVVYESTVYPGVTEDICGPALEQSSGLVCGKDFFLGYSPERINPGDREHTVDRITKVVAGETPDVLDMLCDLYGSITSGGVHRAKSIKVAEAAKVIENAQRDINIAFMNEIAMIFQKIGVSTHDVLEAAGTKWNFLNFKPGLVGGHCIGIDPYYLSHLAQKVGHHPDVILSGRKINDGMGAYIADELHGRLGRIGKVLILGLTFKEDVPDLRNSKVFDVIMRLKWLGHGVTVHDPNADPAEARLEYEIDLDTQAFDGCYDAVVLAVPHATYRSMRVDQISRLVKSDGLIADIKGAWRHLMFEPDVLVWRL